MNLFDHQSHNNNLLPQDGEVYYFDELLNEHESEHYFKRLLLEVPWESDIVKIYGKTHITKRKVAWYGSKNFEYTYSGMQKVALPFTSELLLLKQLVESYTDKKYNSCLLNLYHSGHEGMGWHSDDESALTVNSSIAILSLGATRRLDFKHKTADIKKQFFLKSGSLIEMCGSTQQFWKHSIAVSKKIECARISLTFRQMK